MLRLLEPLQYRVEYRSIIVVVGGGGAVINVVNHAAAGVAAQHLFDKHAITCVTDTRRLRCSDCRIFTPLAHLRTLPTIAVNCPPQDITLTPNLNC